MGQLLYLSAALGPPLLIAVLILNHLAHLYFVPSYSENERGPHAHIDKYKYDSEERQIPSEAQEAGLVLEEGYPLIISHCSGCHSLKLVTQNRATRNGWADLIAWMQEKHNLWNLGPNREPILDYLSKYYGPTETGRRPSLAPPNWYHLENPACDG